MNKELITNCECCGKEIIKIGNQKFCPPCSLHHYELQKKVASYKRRVKDLTKRLYGTENGTQRRRWKKKQ